MLLTGSITESVWETAESLRIPAGTQFEIDHEPALAHDHLTVYFTGLVFHTSPVQMEILRIEGKYEHL